MKAVLETWRPVPGYEGLYDVSDLGAVRSHYGGKVEYRKCQKNKYGYIKVCLCKNGKKKLCSVHRLVYTAFVGDIDDGLQIDHVNTIRDDNRLVNLRCVTPSENHQNSITAERMKESNRRLAKDPKWQQKNREASIRRAENPQWRQKIREAAQRRQQNPEWLKKNRETVRMVLGRPIVQLDVKTGEVIRRWECVRDAARELEISAGNISLCCRGKRKTVGNFIWRYATDDD